MTAFTVPAGVHKESDRDGNLVLLNRTTGTWHRLNRSGAVVYEELRRTANVDHVAAALAEVHTGVSIDRIREDVEQLVFDLVRRGLLVPVVEVDRSPSAVPMAMSVRRTSVSAEQRAVAMVALGLALVLLRLPFRTSTGLVTWLKHRLARRDATEGEALRHLVAVQAVSKFHPGRVACLELSLAAVLAAALLRRRIDWCFGFAVDPQTLHAWIEVGGCPVTEPGGDPISPTYRRVFQA